MHFLKRCVTNGVFETFRSPFFPHAVRGVGFSGCRYPVAAAVNALAAPPPLQLTSPSTPHFTTIELQFFLSLSIYKRIMTCFLLIGCFLFV